MLEYFGATVRSKATAGGELDVQAYLEEQRGSLV